MDVIGADVYWLCGGAGSIDGSRLREQGGKMGEEKELRKEEEKNRGEEEKRK